MIAAEDDPLALANYLYIFRSNDITSTNSDSLVSWGLAWVNRVLTGQVNSARTDENLASAALIIISLIDTSSLNREIVRDEFHKRISLELEKRRILYANHSYSAIMLRAVQVLGIESEEIPEAIMETSQAFLGALPNGRLYGLPFIVQVLRNSDNYETLSILHKSILDALEEPEVNYENFGYLTHSLLTYEDPSDPSDSSVRKLEMIVNQSPAWAILACGETLPSLMDLKTVIISHLYRATLLEITVRYDKGYEKRRIAQLDDRYGGHMWINALAFFAIIATSVIFWSVLLYKLWPQFNLAYIFWFEGNHEILTRSRALFSFIGISVMLYLFVINFVVIRTFFGVLISDGVTSDRRLWEILRPRLAKASIVFLAAFLVQVMLGLFTEVLGPGMQYVFNGKK